MAARHGKDQHEIIISLVTAIVAKSGSFEKDKIAFLEIINDWAFDRFGEPFAESGDKIEINCILIKQLEKTEDM